MVRTDGEPLTVQISPSEKDGPYNREAFTLGCVITKVEGPVAYAPIMRLASCTAFAKIWRREYGTAAMVAHQSGREL